MIQIKWSTYKLIRWNLWRKNSSDGVLEHFATCCSVLSLVPAILNLLIMSFNRYTQTRKLFLPLFRIAIFESNNFAAYVSNNYCQHPNTRGTKMESLHYSKFVNQLKRLRLWPSKRPHVFCWALEHHRSNLVHDASCSFLGWISLSEYLRLVLPSPGSPDDGRRLFSHRGLEVESMARSMAIRPLWTKVVLGTRIGPTCCCGATLGTRGTVAVNHFDF